MNGIDPKWVFWLGIMVTIETAIGQGAIKLTNVVPADWAPYIVGWSQLLGFIGTTIMTALSGFSSANKGPLIAAPAIPPAVKPVVLLALALTGLLAFGGSEARAQAKGPTPLIGKIIEAGGPAGPAGAAQVGGIPKDILAALDDRLLPDLQYAKAMADATGSKVTANCYGAWIKIIQNRQTALKNPDGSPMTKPDPHIIVDFEYAVELRNALQPDSDFSLACSPVANMVKQDVLGLMSKVMAGGAGLALLGVPIIP